MKLKIGRSGYVLLPPDILEAVGLSHDVGGTVEVHVFDGSVVLGNLVASAVACTHCGGEMDTGRLRPLCVRCAGIEWDRRRVGSQSTARPIPE